MGGLAVLAAKAEPCILSPTIECGSSLAHSGLRLKVPGGCVFRTVEYLLRPKSIALLGASDSSRGGWVQEIYDNLEFSGFPAKLYLVNPKRRELWGRPVYPNFAAIPEAVDLALTIIPTVAVVDTLAEAAASGLKCALI